MRLNCLIKTINMKISRVLKFLNLALIICVFNFNGLGQEKIECPALWGIAKMTFLVSDFGVARNYYGRFLGFAEAFSYTSPLGKTISFKVNDRQFIEFIEDADAKNKARLVSVSFETEAVEQMRKYLQSRGVEGTIG